MVGLNEESRTSDGRAECNKAGIGGLDGWCGRRRGQARQCRERGRSVDSGFCWVRLDAGVGTDGARDRIIYTARARCGDVMTYKSSIDRLGGVLPDEGHLQPLRGLRVGQGRGQGVAPTRGNVTCHRTTPGQRAKAGGDVHEAGEDGCAVDGVVGGPAVQGDDVAEGSASRAAWRTCANASVPAWV